jgi:hypothetical protein
MGRLALKPAGPSLCATPSEDFTMKLAGQKVEGPNVETIVIPRGGDKKDIVFLARAIMDFDEFNKLCPEPQPPAKIVKGNRKEYNLKDPGYLKGMAAYGEKRIAWIIIQSLKATPDLVWETVDEGNHRTWSNYQKELKDAGFSHFETQRIINGVFAANCLNEARVEEARNAFLLGQEEPASDTNGPSTEPAST